MTNTFPNTVVSATTDLSKFPSSVSRTASSDTAYETSNSTSSTAATTQKPPPPATSLPQSGTGTPTSFTSPSSADNSPSTSSSSSQSTLNVQQARSTTSPQSPVSSTLDPTLQPNSANHPSHRLSNGAVAGIVIGAALGLAFITFLATFIIMRRQRQYRKKKRSRLPEDSRRSGLGPSRHQGPSGPSGTYENYLPQSADDTTIQHKVRSTLDQIELHVENFYRDSSSASRLDNVELAKFDSPYLSASLETLLPRSRNNVNIIKHALAQSVTASISTTANSTRSLLPTEFSLLPNTITSTRSSVTLKPGFAQTVSQWRVMTAYLRPDPTKDPVYTVQRDRQISETVQSFAKAFAPWKSTGFKDEERARSLSAILEDAASLGIFLFSQSSTLEFHWPAGGELRPGKVVVSPSLLKTADEKGQDLERALVMVDQEVRDA